MLLVTFWLSGYYAYYKRINSKTIYEMMANKMKMTRSAPSILILQIFLGFTSASVFLINRNPPGQPWLSRDTFRIPSSLCQRDNTNGECDTFEALSDKHQNCSCYWPSQNSSFVYHEKNGRVLKMARLEIFKVRESEWLCTFLIYPWWNVKVWLF